MPPPIADPPRPMKIVSQTGIGSGPGTAQRASAPKMNPEIARRRIAASIRTTVFQGTKTASGPARSCSDLARVGVEQIRLPRRRVSPRTQVAAPGPLFVADGAELPHAEGRAVCPFHRPGLERLLL